LNTGINTGIPILSSSNTEIPVLGNTASIAGSNLLLRDAWPDLVMYKKVDNKLP